MIIYELVEEQITLSGIKRNTYGIKATDNQSSSFCLNFSDVFNSLSEARKYIDLFNEEGLEVVHLKEVIENILLNYK